MSTNDDHLGIQISALSNRKDTELVDIIGAYALSQMPDRLVNSLAVDRTVNAATIREAADRFMSDTRPILVEALCGPAGIGKLIDEPTIRDIIQFVVPALGLSALGFVPTAIIALCVILGRSGVRHYCKQNYPIRN